MAAFASLPLLAGCAGTLKADDPIGTAPALRRPTATQRLIWFFPDRGMDLLDIFSLELSAGYGLGFKRRATDWLQLPNISAYRAWNLFSWNYNRRFHWFSENKEYAFGLLPFYWYRSEFRGRGRGTEVYTGKVVAHLEDPLYTGGAGDPWAIGGYYGPPLLGPRVAIDLHPLEVADFVGGLLSIGFLDISGDDWVPQETEP